MEKTMAQLERITGAISEFIWQGFLPILVLTGLYVGIKTVFVIKKQTTEPAKMTLRQFIGPTSISLGAMMGTGAIIGVLGALNGLAAKGQAFIECLALWTLLGSFIMVPLSYSETLLSKIMNKEPKKYIATYLGPILATVYAVSFVALYVFGFGGFQFSGIGSVLSLLGSEFAGIDLTVMQRYLFIVVPLIIVTSAIVLTKKHEVFINAMAAMIGFAVAAYFAFFIYFTVQTADYLPMFMDRMVQGMQNPVPMMLGIPMGVMLALQRIIQTTESGIGGLPMAAHENDSKPRAAAVISIIPVIITIFVAVIVTSYITSYGVHIGLINLPSGDFERLAGFFNTASAVTGNTGLIILAIFSVLSGATTLLGSYYYIKVLFDKNSENKNIVIYILLLITAGTLATFGFDIVFDMVDLLIFLVTVINVLALVIFVSKGWKNYRIDAKNENLQSRKAQ